MKRTAYALIFSTLFATAALADQHTTGAPALSSRPGAAYTLYLNFTGFNYTGVWVNSGNGTPGTTNSYFNVSAAGAFNASQQASIKQVWARTAEKYVAFNVNVTTVDPAATAGQAATDAQRQAYYESTARMMHTVIGGSGGWFGNAGGVSYVGVAQNAYGTSANGGAGAGWHTNWVFAQQAPSAHQFVAEASAHEDGHALSLSHQGDYNGTTKINEYSAGNGTGVGSYAPTMGVSYNSQRGTWRQGGAGNTGVFQNDVQRLISANSGMGNLIDDGIGHTTATATDMFLTGGSNVDSTKVKGYIMPASSSNPNPIGEANYTKDLFKFYTTGTVVTLSAFDGSSYITPGVADPGATLNSNLRILDAGGNVVATATRDSSTLFETFSGALEQGYYYAQVTSYGGFTYGGSFNSANYYDMGSYFLTGSGLSAAPVPEPATMLGLAAGLAAFARRRRNKK